MTDASKFKIDQEEMNSQRDPRNRGSYLRSKSVDEIQPRTDPVEKYIEEIRTNYQRLNIQHDEDYDVPRRSATQDRNRRGSSPRDSVEDGSSEKGLQRKNSSEIYPFTKQHIRKHQSNIRQGVYDVRNFEDHLQRNLKHASTIKRSSTSSPDESPRKSSEDSRKSSKKILQRKESHPEILEKRKLKLRSISQPHLNQLELEPSPKHASIATKKYGIKKSSSSKGHLRKKSGGILFGGCMSSSRVEDD